MARSFHSDIIQGESHLCTQGSSHWARERGDTPRPPPPLGSYHRVTLECVFFGKSCQNNFLEHRTGRREKSGYERWPSCRRRDLTMITLGSRAAPVATPPLRAVCVPLHDRGYEPSIADCGRQGQRVTPMPCPYCIMDTYSEEAHLHVGVALWRVRICN